ncbi:MAG: YhdH/YhfP family quinone oxidoreductase [Anaerolineae bacterium]|nr:YhdH/YhfP family quinone oxidoreductase [Candidatus Roseilinea sp.]MDW8450785.1 YhdH/YhfP family quinone oxidoreductase [Anaerolineae bacterium]
MDQEFIALVVSERSEGGFERSVTTRRLADLPANDALIRVRYSSLNYKDALSATGHRGVTRRYPHTPGIDAAGEVVESASADYKPGDEVIVTGYDLGMNTPGGFGQYIRVPSAWVVRKPEGLTLRESMALGTAGFTAALSVHQLRRHGVTPEQGDVLVSGASGGVGCLAVVILSKLGYRVVAATGKADAGDWLRQLGAQEILSRDDVRDSSGKALLKERWAGVVDTVGGEILATAIKATKRGGCVACCGNVASPELHTTVYPFILRGVTLQGVDSAETPMPLRAQMWCNLAGEWKPSPAAFEAIAQTVTLDGLSPMIDAILQGRIRGRVVVDLGG